MPNTRPRAVTRVRKSESSLELRQLRAFVALVDRGSVTAAAEALGLAQSTVSESLSALERALGASVTVRRRGVSDVLLTAAGHALLPHARAVLATLDSAQIAVAGATSTAHAAVDIVANESVSTYVLAGILADVRRRWPNTRFSVSVATCPGVRAGVEDGAFDAGLLLEATDLVSAPTAGVERVTMSSDVPLIVFAGPAHPLASAPRSARAGSREAVVRRDALTEYRLFMSDAAGDFHALVRRFLEADGLPVPHLEATGSIEGVKRGVAADERALGLLPAYAVMDELRSGRFTRIAVHPAPPRMRLDALVSTARGRHPALDELLASIRRLFGDRVTEPDASARGASPAAPHAR